MLLLVFDYVTFHSFHELHFFPHALNSLSNITSGDFINRTQSKQFQNKRRKD